MNSIGTNASRMMIGDLAPTSPATLPSADARLYAGATDATAMTMLDARPMAPSLSPFRATGSGGAVTVMLRLSQVLPVLTRVSVAVTFSEHGFVMKARRDARTPGWRRGRGRRGRADRGPASLLRPPRRRRLR